MKRLILLVILTVTYSVVYGQKSIDALFKKYAGKEGFTTLTLNGNLLNFARCIDDDLKDIPGRISEIRILTQEDGNMKVENFYDLVINDIDVKDYEEFLRVKESDQDLRILVRTEGKRFKEFLLIAGGDDNSLIQIKGDLSPGDANKLSKNAVLDEGMDMMADQ